MKVSVLSRFVTPAQQRRALEGFADGTVDVLVGTHRLLSADVNPHGLGLVIIDEEQRFGVQHKEQLKNMREQVDVLTLSATPIPRTMQMAMSGVRDMSLILTPPPGRKPVQVMVSEYNPDLVSAAIRSELEREGQVYYVSNRVTTIDEAVARRAPGVEGVAEAHRRGMARTLGRPGARAGGRGRPPGSSALRVDNIENAIADLMAKGVRMIDEKPRIGAGGAKIAFLHPKSTKGVLLEICEHEDR